MKTRILLTTTSFQDTPGEHHELLKPFEVVTERGPLSESQILDKVGDVDALLCGDDHITRTVLNKALPRLKLISKYGIGLDKIDMTAATELKIPVTFCPGVNHTTVAEHTFGLLLAIYRHIVTECNHVKRGEWKRITGHELAGKRIGIIGMGRIGKEVAKRARAFGMEVWGYDQYWDEAFAKEHGVQREMKLEIILEGSDILSLHTNLTEETRNMINRDQIQRMKKGAVLLNCARGELVDSHAVAEGLRTGQLFGYGADVLEVEPPPSDHPLFQCPNAILTPHIGSRTFESVGRQAKMAAENLVLVLQGKKALAQANTF